WRAGRQSSKVRRAHLIHLWFTTQKLSLCLRQWARTPFAPAENRKDQSVARSKPSYDRDKCDLVNVPSSIVETEVSAIASTSFVGGSMHGPAATVNAEVRRVKAQSLSYVVLLAGTTAISGFLFGFDTAVINGVLLLLRHQFALSNLQTEIAASSLLLGCL